MDPTATAALVPLVSRRFHSFADAAEKTLTDLTRAVPGTIVFGQVDSNAGTCRVTDVHGEPHASIDRHSVLPLAESVNGSGRPDANEPEQWLDGQYLLSLGLESWLCLPLEMSDGNVVGLVCAMSPETDAFKLEHGVLLAVASRLLSYEWEEVRSRAELRQLRQQVVEGTDADPDTGLSKRGAFITQLEREHGLAKRGTHNTAILVCRVSVAEATGGDLSPIERLALKDVAAVLSGAIRDTDHLGRIAPMAVGVGLVGVDHEPQVAAFVGRFEQALQRATHGRPTTIEITYGHRQLADEESGEQALATAEDAAEPATET